MKIIINDKSTIPKYLQIASQIKEQILQGEIYDGFTLPSERNLAQIIAVHRNTVRRAYDELEALGFIEAKQGINYRVTYQQMQQFYLKKKKIKKVNWENVIKSEYLDLELTFDNLFSKSYSKQIISFAGGMSSPDIYDEKEIASLLALILSGKSKECYFYTPYQGDYGLRKNLATFMCNKGVTVNPSEIQVLAESNQVLDFTVSLLLNPGDWVVIEEPSSPDVYRTITLAGGKIITVPLDENGIICDRLEPILENNKPKFIYVNSSYNDPTGIQLSLERRKKLLELSYNYRIPIIEEDAASELCFEGKKLPPIKAFDVGGNVIYLYTFALTFIPGLSISLVAAPKQIIKSLSHLVSLRLINLDWLSQKLLNEYIDKGIYQEKLILIREEYKFKRDLMCSWLEKMKEFGIKYQVPKGGVYIWCTLPNNINIKSFAKNSERNGVAFIPGTVFYPGKNGGDKNIRLNFSHPSREEINKGMKIIMDLLEKELKIY